MKRDRPYNPGASSELSLEWVKRQFDEIARSLERRERFVEPSIVNTATMVGTSSSSVSDLTTLNDGNVYTLNETTGTPGYSLPIEFEGVESFDALATKAQYDGGASPHYCELQVYNWATTSWDTLVTIEDSNGQNYRYIELPPEHDYLDTDGSVDVRFFQTSSGVAGHTLIVDFISVVER